MVVHRGHKLYFKKNRNGVIFDIGSIHVRNGFKCKCVSRNRIVYGCSLFISNQHNKIEKIETGCDHHGWIL